MQELIPSVVQTGDELLLYVEVVGQLDYTRNTFIIETTNYAALPAFVSGSQVDFYSNFGFSNSFEINTATYVGSNTELEFTVGKKGVGFAALMETGLILESDFATSGNNDNDRFVFYAAPKSYFSKDGVKHGTAFADKGGASDLKSVLDALEKMMPDVAIDLLNLKPTAITDIAALRYSSLSKAKDMLFLLGLTKVDFDSAQATVGASLSNVHIQLYKFKPAGSKKTDMNGVEYFEYELQVAGLNSAGVYTVIDTGLSIYSIDQRIFATADFAGEYGIDQSIAAQVLDDFLDDTFNNGGSDFSELQFKSEEQIKNLKKGEYWTKYAVAKGGVPNEDLFNLDPTMKLKINELRTALDNAPETVLDFETVLKQKGAAILAYAKARIKIPVQPWTNKDGILYLTRLIMQVVINNHPVMLAKFPTKRQDLSDLFEKHSRGLEGTEKPDFSGYSDYKILVAGYDPFGAAFEGYRDNGNHQSNPSGNIALALDDLEIIDGSGRKAKIKTVIFPVRFREFDKGWVEKFFKEYIDPENSNYQSVNAIFTFSYGGADHFNIDRFASRYRKVGNPDNDQKTATASAYLDDKDKNALEFIETTLPYLKLHTPNRVLLHQHAKFHYYKGTIKKGSEQNFDTLVNSPLEDFPNFANYPSALDVDRISATSGSGGSYLSNEIYYRVSYLRNKYKPALRTGHIHTGFLTTDPAPNDRISMLSIITESIKKGIESFDQDQNLDNFMKILQESYTGTNFFTGLTDITYEEINQLSTLWQVNGTNKSNKVLFELDPSMKMRAGMFKLDLDRFDASTTIANAKDVVEKIGADIFKHNKSQIRTSGEVWKNKDGIIYLTRLILQVILKNHPNVIANFTAIEISELYDVLEQSSRGLDGTEQPNFAGISGSQKKILISGFDPYGSGFDWEGHNSNPSGNVALSLDGTIVPGSGGKTGHIKAALFPVRYKEFDNNWVEDFYGQYIEDVDMIITFSYRGYKTGAKDFQFDRFASDFRYGELEDNDDKTAMDDNLNIGNTFIENNLPYEELAVANVLTGLSGNPCVIGVNHRAYWEVFADKISPFTAGVNVTGLHSLNNQFINFTTAGNPKYSYWDDRKVIPIEKIVPFDDTDFSGNNQVSDHLKYTTASDPDEIKKPSTANYPSVGAWVSDYNNFTIKARIGSGQFYHSNEIHYRVANLRESATNPVKTGHIHIGFLHKDAINGLVEDRDKMIEAINYMVKKMLNAL